MNGRALVFHYPHQWTGQPKGGYQPHSSIRQGDWKAIYFYENQVWELYHLTQDIGESLDLSQAYPGKLERLAITLKQKLIDRGADWPVHRELKEDLPLMLPDKMN